MTGREALATVCRRSLRHKCVGFNPALIAIATNESFLFNRNRLIGWMSLQGEPRGDDTKAASNFSNELVMGSFNSTVTVERFQQKQKLLLNLFLV